MENRKSKLVAVVKNWNGEKWKMESWISDLWDFGEKDSIYDAICKAFKDKYGHFPRAC